MNKLKGIALIQVLLLTTIMSVMALYLNSTAKAKVRIAELANNRSQAEVLLHSAESELTFNLLTEDRNIYYQYEEEGKLATYWNFHSRSFELSESVKVSMQDQSGLLSVQFIYSERFKKLLVENGVLENRAENIIDSLIDWQDADNDARPLGIDTYNSSNSNIRNGYIPDLTEIEHFLKLSELEKSLIYQNTTHYYIGDFNPLNSPYDLLRSITSESVANQLVEMRNSKMLNPRSFKENAGIEIEEDMRLYPSSTIDIRYEIKLNDVHLTNRKVISLAPYAKNGFSPLHVYVDIN